MHLVMLETNGNQRFVFTSPRQRENIGASYLLTMLAPWTLAVGEELGIDAVPVSVSSGKIILTVQDESAARALIGAVSRRVLAIAPGMDVSGVFKKIEAVTEDELKSIHVIANRYNLSRPPGEARFSQTPYLERAKDSALPTAPVARILGSSLKKTGAYSLPSQVKRSCAPRARERLVAQARRSTEFRHEDHLIGLLAESLKALEDAFDVDDVSLEGDALQEERDDWPSAGQNSASELSKVAVIHIDGNGVGAIMQDLEKSRRLIPPEDFEEGAGCPKEVPDSLRAFLLAVNERLDYCVRESFFRAWRAVAHWWQREHEDGGPSSGAIPVVPILLGGDDLTVLTEGRYALPFMDAYLTAYEDLTGRDLLLRHLSPRARRTGAATPMTAAGGAAIVPRPFPFHLAYTLAERLVSEAKRIGKIEGRECSTLTYHALFDSTIADAGELLRGYETFTARPYRLHEAPGTAPAARADDGAGPVAQDETAGAGGTRGGTGEGGPAAQGEAEPPEAPRHGTPWQRRLALSRCVRGLDGDPALPPVPKTRSARIRKLLSDRAAAPGERAAVTKRIRDEWEDARRVLGRDLVDAIGDPRYVFDLIELTDLLPAVCLDPGRETSRPSVGATAQENQ